MIINQIFEKVNEYYVINNFNKKNFKEICEYYHVIPTPEDIEKLFETSADEIAMYIYQQVENRVLAKVS